MIKAIETSYAGCRFRSRLEARWAVFFDHLAIRWEYEPQGYELPSGRYLPDFWLPDAEAWIEIKGQPPTKPEKVKLFELAHAVAADGHRVRLLAGDVPRQATLPRQSTRADLAGIPCGVPLPRWIVVPLPGRELQVSDYAQTPATDWIIKPATWRPGGNWTTAADLTAALTAARSARFEHGQHGA